MRPGTPGFVGARLREAREARGLTAISLADTIGVSRQAISQFENGLGSPSPETMDRIVERLNLPTRFFLRPVEERAPATIYYRKLNAATKAARLRAEWRYRWLQDIAAYAREYIELPPVNFPDFDLPADPSAISDETIERIAREVRQFWGLRDGPISNVTWLLENNGAVIARDELGVEALDAFSGWLDGTPYIVLGADKGSAVRSRLDAAHELGHLVLHRKVTPTMLARPADLQVIERQAFRFAGAFLLPDTTFARDLYVPTLEALRNLKTKWLVSIGVMIKRAEDLDLVSSDQARRLWISYSRRGWRRQEPLDDRLPAEQPRLLRKAVELMLAERLQSRADIRSALPFAQRDVEQLAGLGENFLNDSPAPVRIQQSHARRQQTRSDQPARIVAFPVGRKRG